MIERFCFCSFHNVVLKLLRYISSKLAINFYIELQQEILDKYNTSVVDNYVGQVLPKRLSISRIEKR